MVVSVVVRLCFCRCLPFFIFVVVFLDFVVVVFLCFCVFCGGVGCILMAWFCFCGVVVVFLWGGSVSVGNNMKKIKWTNVIANPSKKHKGAKKKSCPLHTFQTQWASSCTADDIIPGCFII